MPRYKAIYINIKIQSYKAVVRNFPKEVLESGGENISSWPRTPIDGLKSFNLLFNRKAKK